MWMRYLMLLLCVILVISGFVLLGLGAWIRYGAATFVDILGPYSAQLLYISYICMGMGSALSFTGLIGCCGAWTENRVFILLFFFIVTMLFVAEIIGTIFVLAYQDLVTLVVRDASRNSLKTVYMGPAATDPISTAWNTVMIQFKCCGFENSTVDFKGSVFSKATGLNYPKTCCVNKTVADCDGVSITPTLIQSQSCFVQVITVIREQSIILGSAAACICILEDAKLFQWSLVSMEVSITSTSTDDVVLITFITGLSHLDKRNPCVRKLFIYYSSVFNILVTSKIT
ncbi:tetraspanin-16 isoform X2 [Esox lucius]|nr:tetraspanin-16 isoform X2 [Esox lucius]XP_019906127.2 tetraspanin-16 isoform X2 [Esox lucius]